jgi:hypothetical protein
MSNLTNAWSRLATAATKHSLSRMTFCGSKKSMKVPDYFVLTLAAAVLLEDCLLDSRERTIGEDIFKINMLDDAASL